MTLVKKAAFTVALFAVANLGFAYAIKRNWIDPAFEGFEQRLAEKSMAQIAEAIEYTAAHFDNLALDYGSWDETYDYVSSGDPEFYKDNMDPSVLVGLGINWLVVVDKSGRVVSGPTRDINSGELIEIPEIPQGQWKLSHPLLQGDTRKGMLAGIMVTQAGPMMVAARDILTSLDQGESRGRVAVGRMMDDAFIRELGERVGLNLQVWTRTDPGIPAAMQSPLAVGDESTQVTIVRPESGHLEAYRWLADVAGNPAVVVRADLSREMVQSASYIARLCLLWIILQAGILVFIITVPLHRAIISPLNVLSLQLRIFRETSDLNLSLDTEQEGEIGEISREFGNMLRQLEEEVEERRRGEKRLRQAAAVFNTATESIVIADSAGIIVDVNSAFTATTGFSAGDVVDRNADVLSADRHGAGFFGSIISEVNRVGKWEGEIWIRHKEGEKIPAWVSVGCTVGGQDHVEQVVIVFNDMTERKNAEEVIAKQANYDMLTKLPNRYLFRDRLRRALVRAKRDHSSVGLLFVDLDGFKKVNDTLGHAAGDEALRHAAKRISRSLRDADTAARLGGDEFAVILPGAEAALDVEGVAQRIIEATAAPLEVHGQEIVLTASIGVAIYPTDSRAVAIRSNSSPRR